MMTVVLAIAAVSAQPPAAGPAPLVPPLDPPVLSGLRSGHPRLLVREADLRAVRGRLAADPHMRAWHDQLGQQAARIFDAPVVALTTTGSRLQHSRTALHRISTLAGLFLLDGDQRALSRAKAEMQAVASLADWNPAHFLDVAEMTAAMALGYDWLYSDLTPDERAAFRTAIIDKGLAAGVAAITARAFWAAEGRATWTDVCFGGLTLGALAVAEDAPTPAAAILDAVRGPVVAAHLRRFAPDGGAADGPGYWGYATLYTAFLLGSLETALGEDFGLGGSEGLAATGQFRMYAIGPSLRQLNYADAVEAPETAPQMLWLAGRYDRPEYAAHEHAWMVRSHAPPSIFHLLWSGRLPARTAPVPPTSAHFRGIDVAVLRGDWRDPVASWVTLKGGSNAGSVGHFDLGSVIIEALGERWFVDLGPDYVDLPEYFGALRSTYFRVKTESHNTLLVDGQNQTATATAPIVGFSADSYRAFAVADLTAAYQPALTRARRGIALIDGRDVLMQDEIEGGDGSTVVWQMATRAHVAIGTGGAVWLRQNGRSASLRVIEPANATVQVAAAVAPAPQAQADVLLLRVTLPAGLQRQRVVVWFSTGDRPPPATMPLDQWK